MANKKPDKAEELAKRLLKLLDENAKPVIRRAGAGAFEVIVAGKRVTFLMNSKTASKRKDIS